MQFFQRSPQQVGGVGLHVLYVALLGFLPVSLQPGVLQVGQDGCSRERSAMCMKQKMVFVKCLAELLL